MDGEGRGISQQLWLIGSSSLLCVVMHGLHARRYVPTPSATPTPCICMGGTDLCLVNSAFAPVHQCMVHTCIRRVYWVRPRIMRPPRSTTMRHHPSAERAELSDTCWALRGGRQMLRQWHHLPRFRVHPECSGPATHAVCARGYDVPDCHENAEGGNVTRAMTHRCGTAAASKHAVPCRYSQGHR